MRRWLRSLNIPRGVWFLGFASLFTDVASEIMYPLLPIFLTQVLGASIFFVGVIEGVAEAVASFLKLFSGYISDRIQKRSGFVFSGYGISNFLKPFVGIATTPWQVLIIRFFDRVGKGIRTSPRDAWLASFATLDKRGKIYGFHRGMDHLGATIGPILATIFLAFYPGEYRPLFLLTFIPGIIALFFILAAKRATPETLKIIPEIDSKEGLKLSSLAKMPAAYKHFLIALIFFTLGGASDAFLLLKLWDSGVAIVWLPLLWAGLHVVKTTFSFYGGNLSDRIGRKKTILIGWMIYAAIYFALAFVNNPILVIIIFLLYGTHLGFAEVPEKAFVVDFVSAERRGTAFGFYHFTVGIGSLSASLIFGFIWQQWGSSYAFIFGAALSFIAASLLLRVPEKNPH